MNEDLPKDLKTAALRVGAHFSHVMTPTVTHIAHIGRYDPAHFKDMKIQNKYIVHPKWLEECYKAEKHLSETTFPSEFNPHRKLSLSKASPGPYTPVIPVHMDTLKNIDDNGACSFINDEIPRAIAEKKKLTKSTRG